MERGILAGLLCLVLCAAPAHAGDRDVAQFLCDKAEKALRAKDYEAAVEDFRRARAEATPFPEAAYGLGAALEKLGREVEAIGAYRLCVAEVEADKDPSSKRRSIARRAAGAIKKLRRKFAELDKLTLECVDRCLAFARERRKSDPRWAEEAYRLVLKLDPMNAEAKLGLEILAKTAQVQPATSVKKAEPSKPRGRALIRGRDLEGWDPGIRAPWSCADGIVTCDGTQRDGHLNWVDDVKLKGRFELRAKVRIAVHRGERRALGIFIGDGKNRWHAVIMEDTNDMVLVLREGDRNTDVANGIPRDFDPAKWHTWRLVVDDDDIDVYIDDQKIFSYRDRQGITGSPALFVQSARVEFKEIEVIE